MATIMKLTDIKTRLGFASKIGEMMRPAAPPGALSNLDFRVATLARAWEMSPYSMLSHALASVAAT
ncbi:MAG: hypothetical protein ACM3U2_17830 [Deltaproteobacteria bacterium]